MLGYVVRIDEMMRFENWRGVWFRCLLNMLTCVACE